MATRPVSTCACGDHSWVNLTRGYVTIFSPEDAHLVAGRNWYARIKPDRSAVYARGTGAIPLHRVIAGDHGLRETDHANNDSLDNRRRNLRPSSTQQNQYNARKKKGCSSEHKGVCYIPSRNQFMARIYVKKRATFLGFFASERDAADAYLRAREELVSFEPTLA